MVDSAQTPFSSPFVLYQLDGMAPVYDLFIQPVTPNDCVQLDVMIITMLRKGSLPTPFILLYSWRW